MNTVKQKYGQTFVEFGLVMGLVAVGMVLALITLKPEILKSYFQTSMTQGGHVESNGQLIVPEASN